MFSWLSQYFSAVLRKLEKAVVHNLPLSRSNNSTDLGSKGLLQVYGLTQLVWNFYWGKAVAFLMVWRLLYDKHVPLCRSTDMIDLILALILSVVNPCPKHYCIQSQNWSPFLKRIQLSASLSNIPTWTKDIT